MALHTNSFRKGAIALTAAAAMFAGTAMLGSSSASAQQQASAPFSEKQCSDAIAIATSVIERHKGKISNELIDSFIKFGKSQCDLKTNFVRIEGTDDDKAFGEFRTLLIALRTASISRPQALAVR